MNKILKFFKDNYVSIVSACLGFTLGLGAYAAALPMGMVLLVNAINKK